MKGAEAAALRCRRPFFWLATASVSVLGYDHGLDEPVILRWNETVPSVE